MQLSRFQWHPQTQAYAGLALVEGASDAPRAHISPHPLPQALADLRTTLGSPTAFCVSDTPQRAINRLHDTEFATLTGGTSGQPKVIARSQLSWIHNFNTNAKQFAYAPSDSIAVLGGLGHSLALYGLLEGVHLGMKTHALGTLSRPRQLDALTRHECTILYATPSQLRLLPASRPLQQVRLIFCGGGALNTAVRAHIAQLCPNASLHVFYGAAETSFVTLGDVQTPDGSVGRPYPQVEVDIRNQDHTGTGTIWVRSPYLFDRYLQGESPHTHRDGDWVTVGEQGWLDPKGYLFLRGRAGRIVNIADETIYLDQLETQIAEVCGLPLCVLLPRKNVLRGHSLTAVLEGPPDDTRHASIVTQCRHNNLHAPREVAFLDPLPLLPSGKPDLQRIAQLIGNTS
ncbi:AMP-binding protein [uncultured Sulfitobacter sp.]|uniref:AMP-binding protein n=1 Tax=uncultured Sulfitobacter sp. TaxID=191468 RepID=UPI00262CAF2E|nr:AMP-binding protein [uncultured Sulfitobacter sp.]